MLQRLYEIINQELRQSGNTIEIMAKTDRRKPESMVTEIEIKQMSVLYGTILRAILSLYVKLVTLTR